MAETRRIVSFDWAIKTLLRDKANFDVLEGFLSALLRMDVVIDSVLESESNRAEAELKANRVDVLARLDGGELAIVEVQYESEVGFIKRLLYGVSKTIVENLRLGETYDQVKKIYSVSIVHFDVGEGDDYVYCGRTEFAGIHTHHVLKLKDRLTVGKISGEAPRVIAGHDIFPEYYLIPLGYFNNLIRDDLDEWVYAIKNEEVPESFKAKKIDRLRQKLDLLKMSPDKRRAYERYLEAKGSDKGTLEDAKEEGRTEGLAEGRAEGEKKKALEIARALLEILDDRTIAAKTGLTPEEIRTLRTQ